MTDTALIMKHTLSDGNIAQIRELASDCRHADGVRVKFNWEQMLDRDSTRVQNFCGYAEERLVGYVQIDGFGGDFEVTGAVLPGYRRRGLFRRLFAAARAEVQHREERELLLVSYPRCPAGAAVARRFGAAHRFFEYRMEADDPAVPSLPHSKLWLREATMDDVSGLARTMALSLGDGQRREPDALRRALQTHGQRYFLAGLGSETVGQIGAVIGLEGDVYLRAVGIVPERRRQGHGRQMLAATVHRLMAEGHGRFALDVETENAQALSLYQACGFHEATAYQYFGVPVA